MLQIVDWRYDWERSKLIICMVHTVTKHHFYVHHNIFDDQEAEEIISFWRQFETQFPSFDFQHSN